MRRLRSIPALACALTLALPTAALAQSAGDNQYQDPFSGQTPSSSQPKQAPSGGGGNSQVSPQVQSSPASSSSASTPAAAGQSQQTAAGAALPRTGFPAFLPLAYGLVLLLCGAALRRGARSRLE
jgi:hypothetical protein